MSKCDTTLPPSLAGMVSSFKTWLWSLQSVTRSAEGWARKKQSVLRMPGPYGGRLNNIKTFLLAVGAKMLYRNFVCKFTGVTLAVSLD